MVHNRRLPITYGHRSTLDNVKFEQMVQSRWALAFDPLIVDEIYETELLPELYNLNKVVRLEFSQYLENYLWKNYKTANNPSKAFAISIVIMINEKCRERVAAWKIFTEFPDEFPDFFARVLELSLDEETPYIEQNALIGFVCHCINALEVDVVRKEAVKITALPSWRCLGKKKLNSLFENNSKLCKYYNKMEKNVAAMPKAEVERFDFYSRVLWRLMQHFKQVLNLIDAAEDFYDVFSLCYVEKFVLLLIDLEAQLTTRRFVHALIEASQVIVHATLSQFYLTDAGTLFFKLVQLLIFYTRFEVDNFSGYALNLADVSQRHYNFVNQLQVRVFQRIREKSKDFCLLNVGSIDNRGFLTKELQKWSVDELYQIAYDLDLVMERTEKGGKAEEYLHNADYLREIIIFHTVKPQSQLDKINSQPLYPNEEVIWDEELVPYEEYDGEGVLPLNRLNLQFLTLHDYLIRNFYLFQMESTYQIRHDLEDVLFRVRPWKHETVKDVVWGGWARMALPIVSTRIVSVSKPFVGQSCPSEVKADVQVNLPKRHDLRREWEQIRRNDVLFLLTVEATKPVGTKFDVRRSFKEQFKVTAARGCEIVGMLNVRNEVIDETDSASTMKEFTGDSRTFRVRLDPNQYQQDVDKQDVYFSFNLLVRRDPKANNFKAVLSTIRQLLNTKCVVPDWLHDVLLGYGEPDAAHYSKINNPIPTLDFNDTFLDYNHLLSSFSSATNIHCDVDKPEPPFRLTFKELVPQHGKDTIDKSIHVECVQANRIQRLLKIESRKNTIKFTPSQIEAIKSGMEPGLTMVVGPPGTGKTDVAVQIIANIYHNWPEERTLIVTHSNQALNQLFEKIMALDVDERHLLRLGHGEEALETSKDFSRYGRVNYVLKERIELLKLVTRLKNILKEAGEVDATCETAGYFFRYTIVRTWEDFQERVAEVLKLNKQGPNDARGDSNHTKENNGASEDVEMTDSKNEAETCNPSKFVVENFPFRDFFDNANEMFKENDLEANLETANACWEYIQQIFFKLDEFRAFELLRNGRERSDYLLIREAKIIAMTCTHAALRRKELVELGFFYDNCVMEEAAQILEVETFVPLLLQEPCDGINRLKRWIMIGDHHQLPPVVQNVAYQKYSNMEQSLFTRFIRLGVPHVQLDAQGRARAEIADLYNWRYKALGNLPHITSSDELLNANPGFAFTYQFINVPDFNGVGESTPSPYFYQNLGEAEYAVALFTYMRILGYPADKISILTTYNGQRSLILDVLTKRCENNPFIGTPAIVSTVDKYQGQQNDYVILSLVRTKLVGHLRDIRRLVVAMSRGRLGLYILGRKHLFSRCLELAQVFKILDNRPTLLQLYPAETFETKRKANDKPDDQAVEIVDAAHMAKFVYEFYTSNLDFLKEKYQELLAEQAAAAVESQEMLEEMEVTKEPEQEQASEQQADNASQQPEKRPGAENAEGMILFEQVDFERLEHPPNYGS